MTAHTPETLAAMLAGTTPGAETETYEITWHVETGYSDGNGIGSWRATKESVPFAKREDAEALRDKWLADGKLQAMHWGELRPMFSYGLFRIRRASTQIAAAPTLATELSATLVREKALRDYMLVLEAVVKYIARFGPDEDSREQCLFAIATKQEDQG